MTEKRSNRIRKLDMSDRSSDVRSGPLIPGLHNIDFEDRCGPDAQSLTGHVTPEAVGLLDCGTVEAGKFMERIAREFHSVGINVLTFRDTCLCDSIGEVDDEFQFTRRGRTIVYDDVEVNWKRRSVANYAMDGNPFSQRILRVLNVLHKIQVPITWSLAVWVLDPEESIGDQIPDPMLVLELPTGHCIPLVRWNG